MNRYSLISSLVSIILLVYFSVRLISIRRQVNYLKEELKIKGYKHYFVKTVDVHFVNFMSFANKFNKKYSGDEFYRRFAYFKKNSMEIARLNMVSGAKYGFTKYADMSKQELQLMFSSIPEFLHTKNKNRNYINSERKTKSVNFSSNERKDWREIPGVIGPVLDQKFCLCCWAISIVGLIQASGARNGWPCSGLSVQELIDCSEYNHKCEGGHVVSALDFMHDEKMVLVSAEEYPLTDLSGDCKVNLKTPRTGCKLKNYWNKKYMNEDEMMEKIDAHGPIIAIVNADNWYFYLDGVIQRACRSSHVNATVKHAIQIVGYDRTAPVPYYIVKNSWGSDFGVGGYLKLAIGKNICGISEDITYLDAEYVYT